MSAAEEGQASAPTSESNDREPYDPSWYTWSALFNVLMGRGTELDGRRYVHMMSIANEEKDYKRCVKNRDWLLNYSPSVTFMRMHIQKLGGDFNGNNIICRRCNTLETLRQGGFGAKRGILLCMNHVKKRSHLEDLLTHEMVHAYDSMRFAFDEKNIKHAACSEIRANLLSGECRWWREFKEQGNVRLNMHFQDCVRRRAIRSVWSRPTCDSEEEATQAVNSVWESCFADSRPFDEPYR